MIQEHIKYLWFFSLSLKRIKHIIGFEIGNSVDRYEWYIYIGLISCLENTYVYTGKIWFWLVTLLISWEPFTLMVHDIC